jgi:hypothetical protein
VGGARTLQPVLVLRPIGSAQVREISIVILSYPDRPDVDLWFGSRCRGFVANGVALADDPITP